MCFLLSLIASGRCGHKWGLLLFQCIHPDVCHWMQEVFARKRSMCATGMVFSSERKPFCNRDLASLWLSAFYKVVIRAFRIEIFRYGNGAGY